MSLPKQIAPNFLVKSVPPGDWQVVSYATILWTADGLWRHPPIFVAIAAPGKLGQKLNWGLVCFVSSKFSVKKNMILSFFLSKDFFWNIFFVNFPYNQWTSQSKQFFSYWWFLMIFCVSQVSQILGSGAPQLVGKCLGYFRVLRWGGRLCNLKVDVGKSCPGIINSLIFVGIEQAANIFYNFEGFPLFSRIL